MSLEGQYDEQNIFAKILRGDMPCVPVYEDDHTLAFMDVFPQSKGHILVIGKHEKARNLLDVSQDGLTHIMISVQKIARAVNAALKPDGIVISQLGGGPAGQTVFHLHVHIIPRYENQTLAAHGTDMADMDELAALAAHIKSSF